MRRITVSLCLIARNEEATIGMTIKSVLALVDEVIVVDTGSSDNTRIIAEGYGARVLEVPWEDDFSTARNIGLAEATGEWVLILDADEFLQPVRPVEFQRLLHEPGVAGYRVRIVNSSGEDLQPTGNRIRLFQNQPSVRFRYPIHEQISPSLSAWSEAECLSVRDSDLTVMHEGHDPDRKLRRRERNARILRKALATWKDEPYFPYQLACDSLFLLDEEVLPVTGVNVAVGHLHNAWHKVRMLSVAEQMRLPWLPDLGAKTASALLALDRFDESRLVCEQISALYPDHPLVLLQTVATDTAYVQANAGQLPGPQGTAILEQTRLTIARLLERRDLSHIETVNSRVMDLYPLRYLGELALLEGKVSDAVSGFEKSLGLDPTYSFGWLGMAECSRFAGDSKRALKLYLRTVTENEWNHRAWARGYDLMGKMEFRDNAASWERKVSTLFPELPAVRSAIDSAHESSLC